MTLYITLRLSPPYATKDLSGFHMVFQGAVLVPAPWLPKISFRSARPVAAKMPRV